MKSSTWLRSVPETEDKIETSNGFIMASRFYQFAEEVVRTKRLGRVRLAVCPRCTPLECQFVVEFAEVRQGCFGVKLSLDFFLYGFYNKKFIKGSGLAEIESKILP